MSRGDGERDHHPQLDGLRAIAVGVVVISHLWPKHVPDVDLTERVIGLGRFGVDLFFVLSGFLITSILIDAKDAAAAGRTSRGGVLRAFYARRFLRIFPLYYLALAVFVAIRVPRADEHLAWNAAYLGNVEMAVKHAFSGHFSHFWSLAVEEQFYLVWPAVVLLVPARRRLAVFVGFASLGPAWRLTCYLAGWGPHTTSGLPMGCFDDLAGGAVLAHLWATRSLDDGARFDRAIRWCAVAGIAACAVHVPIDLARTGEDRVRGDLFLYRSAVALVGMAAVGAAARGVGGVAGRVLASAPMTYVGRISYGIYILHPVVPFVVARLTALAPTTPAAAVLMFVVYCAITLAAASASWFLYERPILWLKRRVPYAPATRSPRSRDDAGAG
jgi:peptidoglycan/LPS O-acetylase OafA/YrhL